MVRLCLFLCILCCATLTAADPQPVTFTTVRGEKFENVRIIGQTPLELSVQTAHGITRIPFAHLSPEQRAQFGYDHDKAVAYHKAQTEARAAQKKAEQEAWTREQREKMEYDRRTTEAMHALQNGWRPVYDPLTRRTYYNEEEAAAARRNAVDFIRGRSPVP